MSRVVILTAGSRGAIQPYVALGLGLSRAGYQVCLGTDESYRDFVTCRGLEFRAVPDPAPEEPGTPAGEEGDGEPTLGWALTTARFDPLRTIRRLLQLRKKSEPGLRAVLASSWAACQGADAIIGNYLAVGAPHVAERMRVPFLWALVQPAGRTTRFPYFLAPYQLRLGPPYNWLSHVVAEQVFWELQRRTVDRWRARSLGLPPLEHSSPYRFTRHRGRPVIYEFSPGLVPRPPDWPSHMQITGYWFLDREPGWQPPASLVDFLAERDDPPVSIGFGSLQDDSSDNLVDLAEAALAATDRRGIVLAGDSGEPGRKLSDRVYLLDSVPHDWLFPRMSAVVHHGGAGTTAAGLRWGRPTVTVPHFADHHFFARQVAEAGAGPPPIPRPELSAKRLAAAIRVATTDPRMRAAAGALSQSIAAENGVERAVEIFRSLCPA